MGEYVCPICQKKVPRDVEAFLKHADQHVIEEIKKQNPGWVKENGICPQCIEYYEKAKKGIWR